MTGENLYKWSEILIDTHKCKDFKRIGKQKGEHIRDNDNCTIKPLLYKDKNIFNDFHKISKYIILYLMQLHF